MKRQKYGSRNKDLKVIHIICQQKEPINLLWIVEMKELKQLIKRLRMDVKEILKEDKKDMIWAF